MSVLTYNGVSLPYLSLVDFRCQAIKDESDTDYLFTEFDIHVQSVISVDSVDCLDTALIDSQSDTPWTDNPAKMISVIHAKLMKPRQTLSFKFNNVEFIPGAPPNNTGTVDACNGPKPQGFYPIEIGNRTWLITYRIKACYRVNYQVNSTGSLTLTTLPGNTVLSNRWEEKVGLDANQFATRTRKGKYIIRSDNASGQFADLVRAQMAVTSVLPGFLRDSAEYTISPDGLAISYTITDREVYRLPPQPAFKAEGEYGEEGSKADGRRFAWCRLKLHGSKLTSQALLVRRAIAIVAGKLSIHGADLLASNPDDRATIEGCYLKVGLYENWVEAWMRVMLNATNKRIAGVAIAQPEIALMPLDANVGETPPYTPYGTSNLLVQAAAYYDPDLATTVLGVENNQYVLFNDETPQGRGQMNQVGNGVKPGQGGNPGANPGGTQPAPGPNAGSAG